MKKLIIFFAILFATMVSPQKSNAQNADDAWTLTPDRWSLNLKLDGKWTGWQSWTPCSDLIVFDLSKDNPYICILRERVEDSEFYTVLSFKGERVNSDSSHSLAWLCTRNGNNCTIEITNTGGDNQVYIWQDDLQRVYHLVNI